MTIIHLTPTESATLREEGRVRVWRKIRKPKLGWGAFTWTNLYGVLYREIKTGVVLETACGRLSKAMQDKAYINPFGVPGDRVHIRYKASVLGVPATMTVLATIQSTGPEQRDGVRGWFAELETKGSN